MNLPENILDFRNHNFGNQLDFVDDPNPMRLIFRDGEFVSPTTVLEWLSAPFEVRLVTASRNPKIVAPCTILFRRVEDATCCPTYDA